MMSVERRWGGPDPDTAVSYTARSGSKSTVGRWKLDRKKRFPPAPPPPDLFLQDNYKVRR